MGAGRFLCVALPFGLTLASLLCILIVMLAGITEKNLDMFEIKTQNLSISSNSLQNLENLIFKRDPVPDPTPVAHTTDLTIAALNVPNPVKSAEAAIHSATAGINITAADLGLADSYKVSLWGYCAETGGSTTCTKAKFNWASDALNTSTLEATASSVTGGTVTLPKELTGSLKTFEVVSKWTQVVYIIALVTCLVELFFGLFAICSRVGSCLTFLVHGIATTSIIAASIMATAESSIVTGAVLSTAKDFGVKATISTGFLAITWLAVAFSVGAGLFWMFTICCCASDHHSRGKRRSADQEKLIPTGAYQRVDDSHHYNNGQFAGQQQGIYHGSDYGVPMHNVKPERGNGAYEPYSHAAV